MKKILSEAFMVASCILMCTLSSCRKATYLNADKQSLDVSLNSQTGKIQLHSDVSGFNIEHSPEWMQVEIKDSILNYTIAKNDTKAQRKDSIVVEVGEMSMSIPVRQAYFTTYIKTGVDNITFPKEGGKKTVKVETDGGNVDIKVPEGVEANYSDGTLNVSANSNNGNGVNGKIILSCDEVKATIHIVVEAAICPKCHGKGRITCPNCKGEGWIVARYTDRGYGCDRCGGYGGTMMMDFKMGSGKITCPKCHGKK